MSVALNHTIVHARDRQETAQFLVDILGLEPATPFGPFLVVSLANDVSLDVVEDMGSVQSQHYAFLVTEEDFDSIFDRIRARGLSYWADPFHQQPGTINTHDGGRGVYWDSPDGHNLEIITRPYGG